MKLAALLLAAFLLGAMTHWALAIEAVAVFMWAARAGWRELRP